METFTVERDDDRDIKFFGELIASAASSDNQAMGSSYSGTTGRWETLKLYKTKGGVYVCSRTEHTKWQGERNAYFADVCETANDVAAFFGHGWLAKELYAEAALDTSILIE